MRGGRVPGKGEGEDDRALGDASEFDGNIATGAANRGLGDVVAEPLRG